MLVTGPHIKLGEFQSPGMMVSSWYTAIRLCAITKHGNILEMHLILVLPQETVVVLQLNQRILIGSKMWRLIK